MGKLKEMKRMTCPKQCDDVAGQPTQRGILCGIPKFQIRKKPKLFNHLGLYSGGADGTRTRDPRRDRPVF